MNRMGLRHAALCAITAFGMITYRDALASTKQASQVDPARVKSAERIIQASQEYCRWADKFLAQAESTTKEAKTLSGTARKYQTTVPPHLTPLKGARLSQAQAMYRSDVSLFRQHAAAYAQHTEAVRQHLGECAASKKAYERNKQAYTLHCQEFHMANIPPPHVCLVVGTTVEEARAAQGRVMEGMRRMVAAEAELMAAEERLTKAEADSGRVDADVRKQQEINLKEQALVEEFGRLQEEHRQLEVERRALSGSHGAVVTKHIKGKVK